MTLLLGSCDRVYNTLSPLTLLTSSTCVLPLFHWDVVYFLFTSFLLLSCVRCAIIHMCSPGGRFFCEVRQRMADVVLVQQEHVGAGQDQGPGLENGRQG